MKLIELLNIIESKTSIDIYTSIKTSWNRKDEKYIISGNSFKICANINPDNLNCDVIGIKVDEITNNLHVCIYEK